MRMATLNQEMVRRIVNTSELVEMSVRIEIIDNYCQKLCDSGYENEQMRRVVVGGLTRYERRLVLNLAWIRRAQHGDPYMRVLALMLE
jgi:hypothetical protein